MFLLLVHFFASQLSSLLASSVLNFSSSVLYFVCQASTLWRFTAPLLYSWFVVCVSLSESSSSSFLSWNIFFCGVAPSPYSHSAGFCALRPCTPPPLIGDAALGERVPTCALPSCSIMCIHSWIASPLTLEDPPACLFSVDQLIIVHSVAKHHLFMCHVVYPALQVGVLLFSVSKGILQMGELIVSMCLSSHVAFFVGCFFQPWHWETKTPQGSVGTAFVVNCRFA